MSEMFMIYVAQSRSERLQSYVYQLWSAVLASSNTLIQHRLPVTSSYQLPPLPPLDGIQVSVTSQQGNKFNPFINSPPLTADVDTNRSAAYRILFQVLLSRDAYAWRGLCHAKQYTCPSVCLTVFCLNGYTYAQSVFHRRVAPPF